MFWFWQTRQRNSSDERSLGGAAGGDGCGRPRKEGEGQGADGEERARHLFSSASSGMIFLPSVSGVIGPVCFMRMTPALSTT